MERNIIVVPKGIRYISEWKELEEQLPQSIPYIMNKTITGCGYTEYCITNNKPVIICSPRKVLLENKADQHSSEENVLYLKDEYATFQSFDEDISKNKLTKEITLSDQDIKVKAQEYMVYLKEKLGRHILRCESILDKPVKILVTYDSFRRVKEYLGDTIDKYQVVVDEFQSIFTDARFKSDTENTFLFNLKGLKNVVYLSATPMMDKYLEELDEFKDLPYYELDWGTEDPSRIIRPILKTKQSRSIVEDAKRIINTYKEGKFRKIVRTREDGTFEEVYSKEAVIYVNSIKNITDLIKYCELSLDNTNILCSDTPDNEKKIKKAFEKGGNPVTSRTKCIGKVPKEGETHKMFTLCTRTVYLGADFYSTNARSFILSDANIDCLSVDITLDLPQILGRQRLDCNPWKNHAELYYRLNTTKKSKEDFEEYLEKKKKETEELLLSYQTSPTSSSKHALAKTYKDLALFKKYKDNFVAVNEKIGSDLKPVFNKLVMIAEMRAFEIQQTDYANRFSVFNALESIVETEDLNEYLDEFYSLSTRNKYKYLCSLSESVVASLLPHLPTNFQNYYTVLGPSRIKALRYNVTDIKKEYEGIMGNQNIDIGARIYEEFKIGERYTKTYIKDRLGTLYKELGYSKSPKATDLEDYFILSTCRINNEETGKRDAGYLIVSKKEIEIKEGD